MFCGEKLRNVQARINREVFSCRIRRPLLGVDGILPGSVVDAAHFVDAAARRTVLAKLLHDGFLSVRKFPSDCRALCRCALAQKQPGPKNTFPVLLGDIGVGLVGFRTAAQQDRCGQCEGEKNLFHSVFLSVLCQLSIAAIIRASTSRMARLIQRGDRTQSQDQRIKPVNLSAIKRMLSRPQKPMPPELELLLFMLYLLKMGKQKPPSMWRVVSRYWKATGQVLSRLCNSCAQPSAEELFYPSRHRENRRFHHN